MIKLIPNTPLKTTIAVLLGLVTTTATVVWVLTNGLRDIKQEMAEMRRDIASQQKLSWTVQDQERWVHALDRANRFTQLEIPEVKDVRSIKNTD